MSVTETMSTIRRHGTMGATCGQVRRAVTAEHPSSSAADWDTHSTVGAACVDCETVRVCPHEPVGADRIAAVSRAIEMMRKRLEDRHTLEDIARTALLSPFHFHRVFREVTATTPGRFLTALRLAEAKRLLVESDMRVTDICITVGYPASAPSRRSSLVWWECRRAGSELWPRA